MLDNSLELVAKTYGQFDEKIRQVYGKELKGNYLVKIYHKVIDLLLKDGGIDKYFLYRDPMCRKIDY